MKRFFLMLSAITLAGATLAYAEEPEQKEKPKFSITPTGRILMDGALYMGGNGHEWDDLDDGKFVDGFAIPDIRLGAKASYGKWKAKIDMGFAYAKISVKDVYFEYDFNKKNLLRGGYFVHQFGLNSSTSSSMKPTMIEQLPNEFFNANPRNLGFMYVHDAPRYLGTASFFVEGDAIKVNASSMGKQAWGIQTRQLWRPFAETGKVAQVGISFNYAKPTYSSNEDLNHSSFTFSVNYPSKVSSVTALKAVIPHANGEFKFSPELLLAKDRLALESQYYYMKVFRKDGFHDYVAQGAYADVRGLLIAPKSYGYASLDGGLATPAPKSLEMVVGYSYTNANYGEAGIKGGIANDINCTFNYYINKWMIARLRYSYTDVRDRHLAGMMGSRHVNTLQARLQIIF